MDVSGEEMKGNIEGNVRRKVECGTGLKSERYKVVMKMNVICERLWCESVEEDWERKDWEIKKN